MAKRHFDEKGHPKLDELTQEIVDYFSYWSKSYFWQLANHAVSEHLQGIPFQSEYIPFRFVQYLGSSDFLWKPRPPLKLHAVYVVGSQASHLPDSYLTGDHDLDLVLHTNLAEESVPNLVERVYVMDFLRHVLNDGKNKRDNFTGKEYHIDINMNAARTNGPIRIPNYKLYPK